MREEVEQAIRDLKKKKAPGADQITAEMLQASGEAGVSLMKILCERIWQGEQIPDDWGKAVIVPIHKKKDKLDCANYRGISLLSHPSKVLTSIIQRRLRGKVEEIVKEEQAGFRQARGTI